MAQKKVTWRRTFFVLFRVAVPVLVPLLLLLQLLQTMTVVVAVVCSITARDGKDENFFCTKAKKNQCLR